MVGQALAMSADVEHTVDSIVDLRQLPMPFGERGLSFTETGRVLSLYRQEILIVAVIEGVFAQSMVSVFCHVNKHIAATILMAYSLDEARALIAAHRAQPQERIPAPATALSG